MCFSIGDKVRIREDLEVRRGYGFPVEVVFTASMARFRGREARVLSRTASGLITLDIDGRFHFWSEDMLETVEVSSTGLLQTGIFGILNTGDKFVVVNDTLVFQDGHFGLLEHYDNRDMQHGSLCIESLYKARAFDAMTEDTQIWARDTVRELTMDELEDILGYRVRLIEE